MLRLERQAKRRRVAIIFHNFDGCSGAPGEDTVVDQVWIEAKDHCRGCLVIFTARDPDFVVRCFERFKDCRGFVHQIVIPGAKARRPILRQ